MLGNLYFGTGGSSTKSFRPEAKKRVGAWVKTILEKSPFIEKIVQVISSVFFPSKRKDLVLLYLSVPCSGQTTLHTET